MLAKIKSWWKNRPRLLNSMKVEIGTLPGPVYWRYGRWVGTSFNGMVWRLTPEQRAQVVMADLRIDKVVSFVPPKVYQYLTTDGPAGEGWLC